MARYIDADMLKELIDGGYDICFDKVPETKKALLNMIDYQETADVRENVHGKWIKEEDRHFRWHCSNCKYVIGAIQMDANFCPRCGARMENVQIYFDLAKDDDMTGNRWLQERRYDKNIGGRE